jgi:diguanylate cyclase (GGDEF)-like protein
MSSKFFSTRIVIKYLTCAFLLLCLVIFSVFYVVNHNANVLIRKQILLKARALFSEIVLTRQWIAGHGGVYVKLRPGMAPNPYLLKVPGLKVVISDKEDNRYTLENPALVTRKISRLAGKDGLFSFHITSLKLLNPGNAPDAFERMALTRFEKGVPEYYHYETKDHRVFFRYMAPLVTKKACLRCHGSQGYKVGDVRGGISISIPATDILLETEKNRRGAIASAIGVIAVIGVIFFFIARVVIRNLRRAESQLREMGSKDFLTGLFNRREAYTRLAREFARADRTGAGMSFLVLDIDHFKQVNDTYGHSAGDHVLQVFAKCMLKEVREYDIVCRIGGEEFLIAMPETSIGQAGVVAERLREAVSALEIPLAVGVKIAITVSIGATERRSGEEIEQVLARADKALYRSKARGRNRVDFGLEAAQA